MADIPLKCPYHILSKGLSIFRNSLQYCVYSSCIDIDFRQSLSILPSGVEVDDDKVVLTAFMMFEGTFYPWMGVARYSLWCKCRH